MLEIATPDCANSERTSVSVEPAHTGRADAPGAACRLPSAASIAFRCRGELIADKLIGPCQ